MGQSKMSELQKGKRYRVQPDPNTVFRNLAPFTATLEDVVEGFVEVPQALFERAYPEGVTPEKHRRTARTTRVRRYFFQKDNGSIFVLPEPTVRAFTITPQ